jgi:ankyrin repeat protein
MKRASSVVLSWNSNTSINPFTMTKAFFYSLLMLMLVVSCECNDMHFRRLPEPKDTEFEGTVENTEEEVYLKKDASVLITLTLSSQDQEAHKAEFELVSWKVEGAQEGVLKPVLGESALKLGKNELSYIPKNLGSHKVTIKVAIKGEEKNVRTFHYTLEAKKVTWGVTGEAKEAGVLTVDIQGTPEALQEEEWHIIKQQWSRGLGGVLSSKEFEDMNTLKPGSKDLNIELTSIALEEHPTLTLTIQGPDAEEESVAIDLKKACVEHLKEAISVEKREALQKHHASVREKATVYQGNYAGAAREDATRELGALYETTTSLQEQHSSPLARIAQSISVLRHSGVEDLSALDTLHSSMKREVAALSTSMRILKPMIAVLEHRSSGAIDPFSVLHDALQPRASDEVRGIDLDQQLDSPLLDVNRKGPQEKTLLHLAIEQGNIPLSQELIKKGAEVNERDNKGKTPLQYAIAKRNQAAIALLQTSGAHQELPDKWQLQGRYDREHQQLTLSINNAPENMRTEAWHMTGSTWSAGVRGQMPANPTQIQYGDNLIPLHIEVATLTETPSLKCVVQGPDNAFQTIGIDLTKACVEQVNAQEAALSERRAEVERYVQETHTAYQLPQETVDHPRDNRDKQAQIETLLGWLTAFYTGYQERLSVFENNLATLERIQVNENMPVFKKQLKALEASIASLKSAQIQLQQQCTTAHEALFKILEAGNEYEQAMETLINDQHLDVNARNRRGKPLLHRATFGGNVEIAKLLLDKGADANARDNDGDTALHVASVKWNVEIAKLLLNSEADINAEGNYGNAPLLYAAGSGSEEIARLLIERGAEVNVKNEWGSTPLYEAIQKGRLALVKLLLNRGVGVNARNDDGDTPLMYATRRGTVEIMKLLLNRGAEVNAKNSKGETALHAATYRRNEEIARLLIDRGADMSLEDNNGNTALMYAKRYLNTEIVRLLTEEVS